MNYNPKQFKDTYLDYYDQSDNLNYLDLACDKYPNYSRMEDLWNYRTDIHIIQYICNFLYRYCFY